MAARMRFLLAAISAFGCSHHSGSSVDGSGSGSATTLASLDTPFAVAVDSQNVYVLTAASAGGSLVSVPIAGGSATTLASGLTSHEIYGHAIAYDDQNVYFLANNAVNAVPKTGGSASMLAAATNATGLTVDLTNVYWATGAAGASTGSLYAYPIAGGSATAIATGPNPLDLAVGAGELYWIASDGSIDEVATSGGSATTLGHSSAIPTAMAVDSAHAYWTNSDGTVERISLTGGSATPLDSFAGGQPDGMNGIAVDAADVFWTQQDGSVDEIPLAGETGHSDVTAASGKTGAWGIATDASDIYWVTATSSGAVMKLAR